MSREEKEVVLHCLRSMIDEELCEECPLWGTTGTDHCEEDCVRLAIKELEQEPCEDCVSRQAVLDTEYQTIDINGVEYVMLSEVQVKMRKLPPVTPQEPCEDAVSRQSVIDAIKNYASMLWEKYHEPFPESTIMEMIQELPSVNPQKPKSEWQHDHEILKVYSDGTNVVLDKIRAEILQMPTISFNANDIYKADVLAIISKYREEV